MFLADSSGFSEISAAALKPLPTQEVEARDHEKEDHY
jgi:hypothetical protein